MNIGEQLNTKKCPPNEDVHLSGAATLQDSAAAGSSESNETGNSVDVTTKLATAAETVQLPLCPLSSSSPLPCPPPILGPGLPSSP